VAIFQMVHEPFSYFAESGKATVDGIPTPILRANYAFRAVRVPAGISVVEFRYRPRSVWLGAAITLGSLAAVATYAAVALGRRRRGAAG